MHRALLAVPLMLLLSSIPLLAARTILFYEDECCRPITEGEFAILYVQGLRLTEPAQGWTVQTAAAALTSLGHQPEGGWILSRYLSEAVMAGLLRNSPFYRKPFTEEQFQHSTALVFIARARGVFPAAEAIRQGEFAVLLAQALKLPAPQGGWSAETAVAALGRQTPPIGPVRGWKPNASLREAEMLQILAPTAYRASLIDPAMEIAPVHAFSIFFGSAEIATEGHFGLFVVSALNIPPPAGGWNADKALAHLEREFGVQSGYGWNASAPLCAEVFEYALRKIAEKVQAAPDAAGNGAAALRRPPGEASGAVGAARGPRSEERPSEPQQPRSSSAPPDRKVSRRLVQELRAAGVLSADPCALVPVQSLTTIWQPIPPPNPPPPPASSSVPPAQ